MGYHTGLAASFAEVKAAIEAALVSEGWALASGILSSGAGRFQLTASTADLRLNAGTGAAGGTLSGTPPGVVKVGNITVRDPITWPLTYELHIHAAPAEVYCVLRYNGDAHQRLAFGVSPAAGVPGTGTWINGSAGSGAVMSGADVFPTFDQSTGRSPTFIIYQQTFGAQLFGIFGHSSQNGSCTYWHDGLDDGLGGAGWCPRATNTNIDSNDGFAFAMQSVASLYMRTPSAGNLAAPLIPVYGVRNRTQAGSSIGVALAHARFVRIDNHAAGEVIAFGADRWKLYPAYRKNAAVRNGESSNVAGIPLHSGTHGYAIRYLGP